MTIHVFTNGLKYEIGTESGVICDDPILDYGLTTPFKPKNIYNNKD